MASSKLVSPETTLASGAVPQQLHPISGGGVLHLRGAFTSLDHLLQFAIDANDFKDRQSAFVSGLAAFATSARFVDDRISWGCRIAPRFLVQLIGLTTLPAQTTQQSLGDQQSQCAGQQERFDPHVVANV